MPKLKKHHYQINLNLNVRGLRTSATLAINERSNNLIQQGKKVYKFGLGQSPFPVPQTVIEALKENAHRKEYLSVMGLMSLREAIADFNRRIYHIETTPENIMIGPGSKELIFILQLVYYGDLIIPTPSWVSYYPQAQIIGRHVYWVPTVKENDLRMSPETLEEICEKDPERPRLVILNYPSNPTGSTYPVDRLKQLAQVARKYHVILVSDEIYGLVHHNAQHVSISRFYPEGTIISNGLSKWCGAGGWRLGTFTFPESLSWLRDAMCTVASETYTASSTPIQYAAITAFKGNNEIDEYLVQSRRVLKAIAKYSVSKLSSAGLSMPAPKGGFYLFPDFESYREKLEQRGIFTSAQLCETIITDTGVALLPGSDFGRQTEELTARMSYVDFDGYEAINCAKKYYPERNLDDEFLKKCCPDIVEGFDVMCDWLASL